MRALSHLASTLVIVALSTTGNLPALAAESGADPDIQTIITTQIAAFGRDDAAQADRFASEGI